MPACVTEPEVGTEAEAIIGCPKWGCGENTPHMETWDFHELDEGGLPNLEGIRLGRMIKGSNAYQPNVFGARLVGTSPGGNLSGVNLIGAFLEVTGPDGNTYHIHIKNVSNVVRYWIGPYETPPIETYELEYNNPAISSTTRPICTNPPGRLDGEGRIWQKTVEAILFTGDRYDVDTKEVTATSYAASGTWFNIACAGSALAKIHLNRHTTASSTSTRQTSWAQRQTLLKMYVSDACGTGEAFTVAHTPLHWQNTMSWSVLTGMEASIEGFWGPNGALCIENHRLSPTYDMFINAPPSGCVQKCSAVMPFWPSGWPSGAYIKTANP